MRLVYSAASVLFFTAALAAAQTATKTGSVEGVVTNIASKGPAAKANVILHNGEKGFSYAAVADSAGRFRFASVEPGAGYFVTASAPGFLADRARHSRPFAVAEDQKVTGVVAPIMPGGAIAGKVVDADGDPVTGAQVILMTYGYGSGKRQLQTNQMQGSNDRGEYRFSSLIPGRYYLWVTARTRQTDPPGRMHRAGADLDYSPAYYPAARDIAGATPIDLEPGGETDGINFRLQKIRLYHIRGKVTAAQGAPRTRVAVSIAQCEPGEPIGFSEAWNSVAAMDGSFDASHMAPGTYCLSVQMNQDTARQTVTLADRDIDDVTLTMAPAFPVKGFVAVEGAPLGSLGQFGILLEPADGSGQTVGGSPAQSDGSFVLENAQPVAYSLRYGDLPPNAYIKSATLNGREVVNGRINLTSGADTLSLVVATDPGQVTGSARFDNGDAAAGITVVIAPAGPALLPYLVRNAASNANGSFSLAGIAPGDYKVFAFEAIDVDSMAAPEYRQVFESMATSVTVHSNGHETADVKVISADEAAEALRKLR